MHCLTATFHFITNLELSSVLQRCACTCNAAGEAAHIQNSWMCPMCCGIHHNSPSCSTRAWNWVGDRSVGSGYGTRYLLLPIALYLLNCLHFSWIITPHHQVMITWCCFSAFMCYAAVVIAIAAILVYRFVPLYGQTHVMVYIGVCSLVGSISVCILLI